MKVILKYIFFCTTAIVFSVSDAFSDSDDSLTVLFAQQSKSDFCLFSAGKPSPLVISLDDYPGVIRAFTDLQNDIKLVTNVLPAICYDKLQRNNEIVIAGTIGKSPVIESLIKKGKINVDDISGRWECFLIQVVKNPFPRS